MMYKPPSFLYPVLREVQSIPWHQKDCTLSYTRDLLHWHAGGLCYYIYVCNETTFPADHIHLQILGIDTKINIQYTLSREEDLSVQIETAREYMQTVLIQNNYHMRENIREGGIHLVAQ